MATRMLRPRRTLHRIGAFRILRGEGEYWPSDPREAARLRRIFRELDEGRGIRLSSVDELRRLVGM